MPPLKFEDPPPAPSGVKGAVTHEDRAQLIEHTGQWAVVHTTTSGNAYNLARRIRTSSGPWAGHTWEAVTRRNPDRTTAKVYARHIAPAQEK
jgi:hypothetical protein